MCKIWNWNPREEGTFVLHHIPSTHGTVELYNLLISSTSSELFEIFETSRQHMETSLTVKMSAIHNFVLKYGATLKSVEFENTYLSSIQFGKNCSVMKLKIKRSKLSHFPNTMQELKDLHWLTIRKSIKITLNYYRICHSAS
uniref:Uncharacterized protein n=1 Tax=Anopheles funestus TaxID=62324 RepID=A0A182RCQ4_ANOFN